MATADKYDRQLRLWGSNGQRALMTSHILLINSFAVGTETLKNLVLPGLGSFTILDDKLTTSSDINNNFFTPHIGSLRGQSAMEYLSEMNPDVKGFFLNSNLEIELEIGSHFLSLLIFLSFLLLTYLFLSLPFLFHIFFLFLDPNFFKRFSLVILANPTPNISQIASKSCWELSVPLILVRSFGFIGTYRFQIRGIHGIVESKPEAELPDLRINAPFPDLEVYFIVILLLLFFLLFLLLLMLCYNQLYHLNCLGVLS